MSLSFTPISVDESRRIQALRPTHRPPPSLTPGSFRADSESSVGAPKALPLVPSAARLTITRSTPDFSEQAAALSPSRFSRVKTSLAASLRDAATSPLREGDSTIVRVAPDPPNILSIRPRAASPLRFAPPPFSASISTSTADGAYSSAEAFARRGQLRTPLSVGCARHYSHSVGFYGSTIQTPRRDGGESASSVRPLALSQQAHFILSSTERLPPSAATPILCSSWVSRY